MGVKGLTGLLAHHPESYKTMSLHKTQVVIDLCNFVNLVYVGNGLQSQYTGEYLTFNCEITKIFENFKDCGIEPIFILDGCHEADFNKADELISRRLRAIGELIDVKSKSARCDSDNPDLNINSLPKLGLDIMIALVRKFQFKLLVLDYESDAETSAIAAALGCPVVSGDSDFYIFNHSIETSPGYRFIPFSEFCKNLKTITPMTSCGCEKRCAQPRGIEVKYFCKASSPLADIQDSFLPLLATMVGNDLLDSRLPQHVMSAMNRYRNPGPGINFGYAIRKCLAVKAWLKSQMKSPNAIINEFIQCQQLSKQDVLKIMNCSFRQYFLPTHLIANHVLPKLGLAIPNLRVKRHTPVQASDNSQNALLAFLGDGFPDVYDHFGLTDGWPSALIEIFEDSSFNPSYLDALYTSVGVLIRPAYEDPGEKSFSHASALFRKIFYGILMDLESKQHKLIGINDGRVVEYFRDQISIYKGVMEIERIPLKNGQLNFTQLLETYAGMPNRWEGFDSNQPAWLNGLICMLTYQTVETRVSPTKCDSEKMHTIVLICAISAHLNQSGRHEFNQLTQQLMRENEPGKLNFAINMVILELGLLFQMMKQLCLLCDLFGQTDPRIKFQETDQVFPSGRLVHRLYQQSRIDPKSIFQKLLANNGSLVVTAQDHLNKALEKINQLKRLIRPTSCYQSVTLKTLYTPNYYYK